MMKRFLLLLIAILIISISNEASALDIVKPEGKKYEYTLSQGYRVFTEDTDIGMPTIEFRTSKRVSYPLMVGFSIKGSMNDDISLFEAGIPVSLRLPVFNTLKMDIVVQPSAAYLDHSCCGINDKIIATGSAGVEIKKFIKKGFSIGVGAHYSLSSEEGYDTISFLLNIGF